jgi:hypothetical protein
MFIDICFWFYIERDFKVITKDNIEPEDLHTMWCMLSKEEAEKTLNNIKNKGEI